MKLEKPHGHKAVLIVDDNPINVKILEQILKNQGYRTLSAFSGQEARTLAKEKRPDLILLDVMMPGENGFDTCILLKRDPATSDIPVIFLSGMNDDNSQEKGLNLGAIDYITKPFKEADVLERTQRILLELVPQAALSSGPDFRLKHIQAAHQAFMIPSTDIPEAHFGVSYLPIVASGNDFYDIVSLDENSWIYFMADVNQHDINGAFLSFSLKGLINRNVNSGFNPAALLGLINQLFSPRLRPGERFSALLVEVNRTLGKLAMANYGNLPIIHQKKQNGAVFLGGGGEWIGSSAEPQIEIIEETLQTGDRIYLFTNGLLGTSNDEAVPSQQVMNELLQCCADAECLPIEMAPAEITNTLNLSAPAPKDDILLMGIEV